MAWFNAVVINKCDLVPNWVTVQVAGHKPFLYWCRVSGICPAPQPMLYHYCIPCLADPLFPQRITHPAPFSQLHANKKQFSTSFTGYPNAGKSSIHKSCRLQQYMSICIQACVPLSSLESTWINRVRTLSSCQSWTQVELPQEALQHDHHLALHVLPYTHLEVRSCGR